MAQVSRRGYVDPPILNWRRFVRLDGMGSERHSDWVKAQTFFSFVPAESATIGIVDRSELLLGYGFGRLLRLTCAIRRVFTRIQTHESVGKVSSLVKSATRHDH